MKVSEMGLKPRAQPCQKRWGTAYEERGAFQEPKMAFKEQEMIKSAGPMAFIRTKMGVFQGSEKCSWVYTQRPLTSLIEARVTSIQSSY